MGRSRRSRVGSDGRRGCGGCDCGGLDGRRLRCTLERDASQGRRWTFGRCMISHEGLWFLLFFASYMELFLHVSDGLCDAL